MSKIFFISDTHFYHTNIIKYCHRPFNNIEEMNETIINNWNRVVSKTDIVYHLGDLAFKTFDIDNLVQRLNGKIYLLRGNHDDKSIKFYQSKGIEVIPTQTKLDDYKLILSHRPLEDNQIPEGYLNIHGHIHDKPLDEYIFDPTKHKCICVELINYTPILIQELE